jgi:hypothetical protein
MTNRKLALYMAGCAAAVMMVMAAFSLATGVTQEAHEHFLAPDPYALLLVEHGDRLRTLMALDVAFTILYACFFVAFARYLLERGAARLIVGVALAALLLTALLDLVEDHHIVTMLDEAQHRVAPTVGAIAFQATESACKFSVSFLGLVLFGLAIPRDGKLALWLVLYLTAGTLLSAVFGYAMPADLAAKADAGRSIGFLVGFALVIAWLLRQPQEQR